ncbi:MAG TPA: hypothetical protein DCL44_02315 [Elusimicrobia bacterium]|nr:hypothetical protein [Elusimicrobiota bacterium]
MKKITFAVFLCVLCAGLNAQVSKTEKSEKTAAVPVAASPASDIQLDAAIEPEAGGGFAVNKRHIVARGDTLWDLSRKYYGDPFKWGKIYNANMSTVNNPDRIYPKSELEIPDITEEIKPAVKNEPVIAEDETVMEPGLESSEIITGQDSSVPPHTNTGKTAKAAVMQSGDYLEQLFKNGDLSEEMPRDQKEWSSSVKVAGDNWHEDGVITAKSLAEDESEDGLSFSGETVVVELSSEGLVKKGDYLEAYLKGATAFDKKGERQGFELQRAGMLEVLSVEGVTVRAKVIDASTSMSKGLLVKKK